MRHALHETSVSKEYPGMVVNDGVTATVEAVGQDLLGQRHTNRVGDPLAQRPGSRLDTRGLAVLRMPRSL